MNQNHKWDEYFSHINWSTKQIDRTHMNDAIDIVKKELNRDVVKILKIMKKHPRVFRLELDDKTVLRFERIRYNNVILNNIRLERVVLKKYKCIPKIIYCKRGGAGLLKLSEWIDGFLFGELKEDLEANKKIGEMYAKLNNIQDPKTGLFITVSEINNTNIVFNVNGDPIIVDLETIRSVNKKGIDSAVYKNLVKRIVYKDRIDMFLNGYSKYRDISGILELAKKNNWRHGKRKMKT
jgi:hypothetical protein